MSTKMERPDYLPSLTRKVDVGCGGVHVIVTFLDGKPFEIFAKLGKTGGCERTQVEALCRSISIGLRSGVDPNEYIKQLSGLQCLNPRMFPKNERILSCGDALAKVLKEFCNGGKNGNRDNELPKAEIPKGDDKSSVCG